MILELFAGIGGCAAAHRGPAGAAVAIDQDEAAHQVYVHNHPHPAFRRNLASVRPDYLAGFGADLWWMSPPCQPHTVRGRGRDVDDPRSASLLNLLHCIAVCEPRAVALENVPGFAGSRAHARLTATLRQHGYAWHEQLICPTELGVPNERRRFYLAATRHGSPPSFDLTPLPRRALRHYLDREVDPELAVPAELLRRYGTALPVVDADDPDAVTHCFTSAYTRSPVYAGSYLLQGGVVRQLSPDEILRLLGFEPPLRWPPAVSRAKRYKLVGNSLSVTVVQRVLRGLEDQGENRNG